MPQLQYAPGYYSYYMNYPQMQGFPVPQMPKSMSPQLSSGKKKAPKRPSLFRPQNGMNAGEQKTENEESLQTPFEELEADVSDPTSLKGKIADMAITQTGSRFLQKQLTKAVPEFISFVLKEVYMSFN